jgi:hypothetical protein
MKIHQCPETETGIPFFGRNAPFRGVRTHTQTHYWSALTSFQSVPQKQFHLRFALSNDWSQFSYLATYVTRVHYYSVTMSDQPSNAPPPVAAKPNMLPAKRAGLKRTFSVGAAPKKSAIMANPKVGANPSGSLKFTASVPKSGAIAPSNGVTSGTAANSLSPPSSGAPRIDSPNNGSFDTGNDMHSPTTTIPGLGGAIGEATLSPARPRSRPSSGSVSAATMTSYRINQQMNSLNGGATLSPVSSPSVSRSGIGRLSSAAYANFAGEKSGYTGPLSPRSAERKAAAEETVDTEVNDADSLEPLRPRRPAAPPRPATLRSSLTRASISSSTAYDNSISSSGEEPVSIGNAKLSAAPTKTGAQLRPPVPKKNISYATLNPEINSKSTNSSPATTPGSTGEVPSSLPQNGGSFRPRSPAQDIPQPSNDGQAPEGADEPKIGTSPVLKRTHTPRSLAHFRSPSAAVSTTISAYVSIKHHYTKTFPPILHLPNGYSKRGTRSEVFFWGGFWFLVFLFFFVLRSKCRTPKLGLHFPSNRSLLPLVPILLALPIVNFDS